MKLGPHPMTTIITSLRVSHELLNPPHQDLEISSFSQLAYVHYTYNLHNGPRTCGRRSSMNEAAPANEAQRMTPSDPHGEPHETTYTESDLPQSSKSMDSSNDSPRGRLKRRRQTDYSPSVPSSPSRAPDRDGNSPQRADSSASVTPPPRPKRVDRRRSDAEPDHTLRGRARNRSRSRQRTGSPILEGHSDKEDEGDDRRAYRKRSPPPSRHRSESAVEARRQRSLPNMYKQERGKARLVAG